MSDIEIRLKLDRSEVDRDLYRISRGPTWFTHKRLDQVLLDQFNLTQMAVHVQTGSLAASGVPTSETTRDGGWEGDITYGGMLQRSPMPGPARNPGHYAIFEFEKDLGDYALERMDIDPDDTGGDHNWLRAAKVNEQEHRYADVLTDWLADNA